MQIRKIKGLKKPQTLVLVAMMMALSMGTTAFASSAQYVSEEGIGIEVENPGGLGTRADIQGDAVSVSGGTLWATWRDGTLFRANYDHSTKEHRCSVTNDHQELQRSQWMPGGTRAISPWLSQTASNNKAYAATK
ncbi:MAG: hypothetical protein RR238_05605 [Lachnospiraceae bacterium]